MKKILLIDGHSILNRGFYGLPNLTNSQGLHTNGVLGFLNIMLKIIEEEKPTNICVAFDVHEPTFRHLMYKEYKGTRKPMPSELREQVPLIKDVLHSMNIITIEKGGYEADDIIGTLSRKADKEGYKVSIISGDRDLLQLATDNILVRIPKTKATGTVMEDYYAKDVLEKYMVTPVEFIDLKGLMGDASDNIPGVPSIGEKTAIKIISQYKSIENAHEHLDEIKPNKAKENLEAFYDQAIFSKKLATIKLDCQLDINLEDTSINNLFTEDAYTLFKQLEFKSLISKFSKKDNADLEFKINITDDLSQAENLIATAIKAEKKSIFPIDSNGLCGFVLCTKENEVNIIKAGGFISQEYLHDRIIDIFNSKGKKIVLNMKEILSLVYVPYGQNNVFDVSIGAYLLNPLKSDYYYDDISRDYLSIIVPAQIDILGKKFEPDIDNVIFQKVACYKAIIPFLAEQNMLQALENEGMLELYKNVEFPTVYSLYEMEKWGVKVLKSELISYGDDLKVKIDKVEKTIYELSETEFNINSPKQLGEVLFEKLQLPNGKKTKTGYSTSVDVLEKLKKDYPIVENILEYRQLTKLKSTYADGLINYIGEDNRIHGKFNQTITATGRISSTEPNLQNIPIRMPLGRLIRKAFVPSNGFIFVDADYSQIELRVLAHLSQDETLINAFKNNLDIHSITASEVFQVPIEEVSELQRRNAKAVNFGIVYGISDYGLSQDLDISKKEAASYIEKYFNTYPKVKEFLDNSIANAKENGFVTTMFNRKRPIPEISSSNFIQKSFGERVAMNSPIQGSAADILKIATLHVNNRIKEEKLESRLVLQVHDELLIETKVEEEEMIFKILEEEMMGAANLLVPLSIGISKGNNWYEAK